MTFPVLSFKVITRISFSTQESNLSCLCFHSSTGQRQNTMYNRHRRFWKIWFILILGKLCKPESNSNNSNRFFHRCGKFRNSWDFSEAQQHKLIITVNRSSATYWKKRFTSTISPLTCFCTTFRFRDSHQKPFQFGTEYSIMSKSFPLISFQTCSSPHQTIHCPFLKSINILIKHPLPG